MLRASTRFLANASSCSSTYRTLCSGGICVSEGLRTDEESSRTRLWIALRSSDDVTLDGNGGGETGAARLISCC